MIVSPRRAPAPRPATQNLAEIREVDALGLHEREELLDRILGACASMSREEEYTMSPA